MPSVLKGDVLEVAIRAEAENQAIVNVLHYRLPDSAAADASFEVSAFLAQFWSDYDAWVKTLAPGIYRVREMLGLVINGRAPNPRWPQPGNPRVLPNLLVYSGQDVFVGGALTGLRVGAATETFAAFGVRYITEKRGRQFRGQSRWFIGCESDTVGNLWTSPGGFLEEAMATYDATFEIVTIPGPPLATAVEQCVFARTTYLKAANAPLPVLRNFTSKVINQIANPYVTTQVSRKQRLRLQ